MTESAIANEVAQLRATVQSFHQSLTSVMGTRQQRALASPVARAGRVRMDAVKPLDVTG